MNGGEVRQPHPARRARHSNVKDGRLARTAAPKVGAMVVQMCAVGVAVAERILDLKRSRLSCVWMALNHEM